jgi:uncharacterized OB-fold protein
MCGGHFIHMLVPIATMNTKQTIQPQDITAVALQSPCPTCGVTITPEYAWCPKCGASLKAHPCDYCGQTINPGDNMCSFCGAPPNKG